MNAINNRSRAAVSLATDASVRGRHPQRGLADPALKQPHAVPGSLSEPVRAHAPEMCPQAQIPVPRR